MGHMGLSGEREGLPGWAARLLPPGPNWTRRGGRRPLSFSLPTSFPLLVGVLLLLGGGLLLGPPIGPAGFLPLLLYIRGQGAPLDTEVDPRDRFLSRVRCPLPP